MIKDLSFWFREHLQVETRRGASCDFFISIQFSDLDFFSYEWDIPLLIQSSESISIGWGRGRPVRVNRRELDARRRL